MKLTHTLIALLLPFLSMAQFQLSTWKRTQSKGVQFSIPPNLTEFESEGPDGKTYHYRKQKSPSIRTRSGKTIKAADVFVSDSGASVIVISNGQITGTHQGGKKTMMLDVNGNISEDTTHYVPKNGTDEAIPPAHLQRNLAPAQNIPAIPRDVKWGKGPLNKTVTGYWEVGNDLWLKYGSQTAFHIQTIAALCRIAYQNEGVDWQLTRVMIWDRTDPYAANNSIWSVLTNFATANRTISEHTGMFHNNKNWGGLGYVAGIHQGLGFGVTGWSNWSIPTSSTVLPAFNWIVECSTHEIGHNFSMKHTHWGCHVNEAGVVVGPLDKCWTCEQCQTPPHPNCNTTTVRNEQGTWMSYCHNNGRIDMNLGLLPESRAMMKDYLWNVCTNIPFNNPIPCTEWTYSAWGPCVNGVQTRMATGIPSGCITAAPGPLSRSCNTKPLLKFIPPDLTMTYTPATWSGTNSPDKIFDGDTLTNAGRWMVNGRSFIKLRLNKDTINFIRFHTYFNNNGTFTSPVKAIRVKVNTNPITTHLNQPVRWSLPINSNAVDSIMVWFDDTDWNRVGEVEVMGRKYVPPPPPPVQCVENLQHYVSGSSSAFKFRVKSGCRYRVEYCRYDNATSEPAIGTPPSACGDRLSNYTPTAAELSSGWIDRIASPQPSIRQRWYSVRVSGSDGVTQMTFFWWP